jgi:hypothetical protein
MGVFLPMPPQLANQPCHLIELLDQPVDLGDLPVDYAPITRLVPLFLDSFMGLVLLFDPGLVFELWMRRRSQ